jgi:hypothetical protein
MLVLVGSGVRDAVDVGVGTVAVGDGGIVGVADGGTVAVSVGGRGVTVAEGWLVAVGEGVRVLVEVGFGVKVSERQSGAESFSPVASCVRWYSSYSFTCLTSGNCLSVRNSGAAMLYPSPLEWQYPISCTCSVPFENSARR